jgi:hypothetical protein
VSLANGDRAILPLPVSANAAAIVGATSRDVLVYEIHPSGDRLTAYTFHAGQGSLSLPEPWPDPWPDPCKLLDQSTLPGYGTLSSTEHYLGLPWPRPNICTFVPPDDSHAQVRVTITWVARTAMEADYLAATKLAADLGTVRLTQGAYVSPDTDRDDRRTFAWAVGGGVIAEVQATSDPALTRRAALALATHLRALPREGSDAS